MGRCVVIGGAGILDYGDIRKYLKEDDFAVYCDSGLKHREGLALAPGLVVGDFDSCENPRLDAETIVLPREKDDTDTVYAAKEAVKRGFSEILILGATGGREDHTLVNIYLLFYLERCGVHAVLLDDYAEMEVISGQTARIPDSCRYFSLLNMTGTARGITIKNAKFPLHDGEIESEYQYAVSNEVLPGKTAEVTVKEGRLLLMKIRRE